MAHTLQQELANRFSNAISQAFPSLSDFSAEVVQSTNEKFGHYQFNSAMKLAKSAGLNPRQVSEKILSQLDNGELIEKTEIAGPGFINITLKKDALSALANSALRAPKLGLETNKPLKVIIDFSSPNTAKEMHVGHLRSTIIGDAIANLFEFLGDDVVRLNHIGDWGTSFGMLIAYMKSEAPEVLNGHQKTDLGHLVGWYKAAKKKFDEEADFKKSSQLEVVALQSGEPQALQAWKIICDISRKAYQEIYDLLNIRLNERGESFYNSMLPGIVQELTDKGLVTLSDGAKCIFMDGFKNREGDPLPLMIQKADGGYNYDTTDMAALKHRVETEKADRLIYVTDAGQSLHFQMVFKAGELAHYYDPNKVRIDHVGFGLVLGNDGKKFKTRSGDTEKLMDLLTTAIDHAKAILDERNPDMPEAEKTKLAKALGLGAIKYADLSSHRISDYHFSYDKMLKFEGNTAAFLMYSYVRIQGIKRKIGKFDLSQGEIVLNHPSEIALGLHLLQFGETLQAVAKDLLPNRLADYLYNLANLFNAFFRDCRVEGTPEQQSRLLLCDLTARTLKQGLDILGIETIEVM